MPNPAELPSNSPPSESLQADLDRFLDVTRERHRHGEDAFKVCGGLSDGIDGILKQMFVEELGDVAEDVALIAVGGYGRREMCPYSDVDLLFLRESEAVDGKIKRVIRLLWDGGFDLGHSVRTLADCYKFMSDDVVTASTLMENRFLCGSERLYAKFGAVVNKYRKKWKEPFATVKFEQLRESLYSPGRTIYLLEPHIKEGLAGLRDIQRFLWIENMRRGHGTFAAFRKAGVFREERIAVLEDAYRFYLRVRCENHFVHKRKQDILEADLALDVARNLGYEGSARECVEGMMADYYRHSRNTYRFLRYYHETGTQGRKFVGKLARKIFATQVKPYLVLYKNRLYLREPAEVENLAEEILQIFLREQELDVRVSESLCEWIRHQLLDEELDFSRSTVVRTAFLKILRQGGNTGRVLKTMHKTGVLDRIIPEFQKIDGLVNFGGHHHFTVDEHTLRTLEKLDAVDKASEYDPSQGLPTDDHLFHRVLMEIEDRLPLRLALILHDIGKGIPGDHSVSGSNAAVVICERLGLPEETLETVEFLVYRHLRMHRISDRQDFTEPGVVESFARLCGTEERLRMLYVLTYIDISSVGPGTWTSWKGAQLAELFDQTLACLRTGSVPQIDLDGILRHSELGEEESARVKEHCEQLGSPGYVREIVPKRMLEHVELVDRFLETGQSQVGHHECAGYHEVIFCTSDRPHLFSDLTGVLLSEGLNVLGARILSRNDGVALDLFHVAVSDKISIPIEARIKNLRRKIEQIDSKVAVVEDLIRQWLHQNRYSRNHRAPRPLYGPSVKVRNDISEECTVVEVNAGDRPGLLHDEAGAINRLGLDLRSAKISTVGTRARDMFYVVEQDGLKVTNPARITLIKQELVTRANSPGAALLQGGLLFRNSDL